MSDYKINPQGNIVKDIINIDGVNYQRIEAGATPMQAKPVDYTPEPHYTERGKPDVGQKYWFINISGATNCNIWNNDYIDNDRFVRGLVFLTKEALEAHDRYLQIDQKIRQLAGCQKWVDWKDAGQTKWSTQWGSDDDLGTYASYTAQESNVIYFKENPKDLLLTEIGAEDLMFFCTYNREIV